MTRICIGIDSFDTPLAGCTTHFASLLLLYLRKQKLASIADYPFLARLNPTIPWKTRGNGAVSLLLDTSDPRKLARKIEPITEDYAGDNRKAGLIVINCRSNVNKCLKKIYNKAVTTLVLREEVEECLNNIKNNIIYTYGEDNIGIKGALAAIGARYTAKDTTYELLTYRLPDKWEQPRHIDAKSVIEFDQLTKPYSFLNYDYTNRKILITPHGYDPVLYGIRAENPSILLQGLNLLRGEKYSHWTIFRTNQATNTHLLPSAINYTRPYTSIIVEGRVHDYKELKGGHLLLTLCHDTCIQVAVYRETGRLRILLQRIAKILAAKNTPIRVAGGVKPHRGSLTLNVEYVELPLTTIMAQDLLIPSNSIVLGNYVRLLPDPIAFHHLMMPLERYLLKNFTYM